MRSLTYVLLVLVMAAEALALAPAPERPISTPPHGRALGDQRDAAIASAGDHALAVWTDQRIGNELYATRLDADGNVLDPSGLRIDGGAATLPSVAWNGRAYVVTAQDGQPNPVTYSWTVDLDGRIGERRPLGGFYLRTLASNGREVVLGANDLRSGVLARLDEAGRVRRVQTMGDYNSTVAPVADGDRWFAFYNGFSCNEQGRCKTRLRFRDADAEKDLTVLEDGLFTVELAAAGDGSGHFLAAWGIHEDTGANRSSYVRYVNYTVVDRTGKIVVPPTRIEGHNVIKKPASPFIHDLRNGERPAVVWDGRQFVVSWSWWDGSGESELRVMRFSAAGAPLDSQPVSIDRRKEPVLDPWREPALAATSSRLIVAWSENRVLPMYSRSDVVYRAVRSFDELKEPAAPGVFAGAPHFQGAARLAAGNGSIGATWVESDGVPRVVGRVLREDGTASSEVFAVSESQRAAVSPMIAAGGGVYAVAWIEEEFGSDHYGRYVRLGMRVLVRRFDANGRALDAAPVELAREAYAGNPYNVLRGLAIASDGQQFLVVWTGVQEFRLLAKRVTIGGTLLDAQPFGISAGFVRYHAPAAVWTGREFFVAWYEAGVTNSGPARPHPVRATRVSPNGTIADFSFPVLFETSPRESEVASPFSIATNGSEVLVTWSYWQSGGAESCVWARRLDLTGRPLDAAPSTTLRCYPTGTSVSTNAVWYRGAWRVFESADHALSNFAPVVSNLATPQTTVPLGRSDLWTAVQDAVVTPSGIVAASSRSDPSNGNERRLFVRRITDDARRRAVGR